MEPAAKFNEPRASCANRWNEDLMAEEIVEKLVRLDACAVSDALDRLRLEGAVSGIAPFSVARRIAGRVRTVGLGPANAAPSPRHLCTAAIEAGQPGDVIVIEQRTGIEAAGWGGILSTGAAAKGIAGVIIEGPARDLDEAVELDFPVYARSATTRTARGRIAEISCGMPITVGNVKVADGDYVIADRSGVVFIKQRDVKRVIEAAAQIAAREAAMAEAARSGEPMAKVMGADYEGMLKR
jgi:regulator of RNase E activity RraA